MFCFLGQIGEEVGIWLHRERQAVSPKVVNPYPNRLSASKSSFGIPGVLTA
jgi:hypothetical protein